MPRVVGVRFKPVGKIYYFDPADFECSVGTKVVVETARGIEYGDVCIMPREVPDDQVVQPLKKVIRIGTERDAQIVEENRRRQKEAFPIVREKIAAHGLDMYLCDVEYSFDRSKITFYFTAEERVDFRELVKDLAAIFHTRIEMRQIGVRDEAKLIGGIGPCGRILCCSSFLGEFSPVSIRMAKDQNLSLNPTKISGVCGRLMCCLRYEQETYEAAKKDPTLAPGYAPPPLEKVEEYLKEYQDEEVGTRPSSLPEKPRFEASAAQVRISSAPQAAPDQGGPARSDGQRAGGQAGEQRRPRQGQPAGPQGQQGQGQKAARSGRPGGQQQAQGGQQPGGQVQPGGQQQARTGQQSRGQVQPGGQQQPRTGQQPGGQGRPRGQHQAGQHPAGQQTRGRHQPRQLQPQRPPQTQAPAASEIPAGTAPHGQPGQGGEQPHRRRRRRRHRGHGGASEGQGGPPEAPTPQ